MAPSNFIQAIKGIVSKKEKGSPANRLIESYQTLRCFFPKEKRVELAEYFVAFYQGKIGEKRFRQAMEILGGFRRPTKKRLSLPTRGYFWKSYSPK